ncbi:MAG: hypothetical protein V4641_31370 [Pseudomonadota bacterium]
MQIQTIVLIGLIPAIAILLFVRRRVIVGLQQENAALGAQLHKLGQVAEEQRRELNRMMEVATQERRARQLATLGSQPAPKAPPNVIPVPSSIFHAVKKKQEEATRRDQGAVNTYDTSSSLAGFASAPAQAAAEPYRGGGGTFDGGGASGDYGRSESSCSSSSSSSDSGSSGSSDSGGSCGSSD